jgi:hypothetical protein
MEIVYFKVDRLKSISLFVLKELFESFVLQRTVLRVATKQSLHHS